MTTSDEMAADGTFCHDNFEHPLLWCEEKKRLVERKNAEDSLRMWRRRKAEEFSRKERDKQEYIELFVKHCPWGRPGGGAPNVDVRRKDITAVGLHSTPQIGAGHRLSSMQPCRYNDYFSQHKKCHDPLAVYHPHTHHTHSHHHHHHAARLAATTHSHTVHHPVGGGGTVTICEREISKPGGMVGGRNGAAGNGMGAGRNGNKSKSGESLEILLKDHASMSFRNKGHVDIEVRYKPMAPGKGKPLLEKIVVTDSDKCPPIVRGVHAHGMSKSPTKKRASVAAAKMEKPPSKDPWGKAGPGGKPWRSPKAVGSTFMKSLGWTNKEMLKDLDQDNPATPAEKPTFKKVRTNKKLLRCCDMCTCSCPAMAAANAVNAAGGGGKSPLKSHQKQQTILLPPQKCPIQAKVDTGKPKICPRFERSCGTDTQQTATDYSANITTSTAVGGGGGVELVPLLARRRANNRPISLSSTDVTKRTASNDRATTAADLRYMHELHRQISDKRRSISTAQQLDRDLCGEHFRTFDRFWGRPGHGAPTGHRNKLKLDNLLYGSQSCLPSTF